METYTKEETLEISTYYYYLPLVLDKTMHFSLMDMVIIFQLKKFIFNGTT